MVKSRSTKVLVWFVLAGLVALFLYIVIGAACTARTTMGKSASADGSVIAVWELISHGAGSGSTQEVHLIPSGSGGRKHLVLIADEVDELQMRWRDPTTLQLELKGAALIRFFGGLYRRDHAPDIRIGLIVSP